ncbi:hypothetical protein Droror1_Dr00018601 [Drosera rotundifolia]
MDISKVTPFSPTSHFLHSFLPFPEFFFSISFSSTQNHRSLEASCAIRPQFTTPYENPNSTPISTTGSLQLRGVVAEVSPTSRRRLGLDLSCALRVAGSRLPSFCCVRVVVVGSSRGCEGCGSNLGSMVWFEVWLHG